MHRDSLLLLLNILFPILLFASDKDENKSPKSSYGKNGIFSQTTETNLLANPGFENKTSNWILGKHNGGSGLFSTDTLSDQPGNRYAIIIAKNKNKDFQDLQLFTSLPITEQTKYTISFEANVKTACLISISLNNGFETLFEEKFLLRPEQKFYGPFIFNSKVEDPFAYFAFNLGKSNTIIQFDEVEINADQTEKEFNSIITKSGININQKQLAAEKTLHISSPTIATSEIPIMVYDDNNNVIMATKINKGEYEAMLTFDNSTSKGEYSLKIFTPDNFLSHNFRIE